MDEEPVSAPDEPPSEKPDSLVSNVAKALYNHAIKSGRQDVAERSLPLEKIRTVFAAARQASDREAAIVVFCLIDDIATDFFREKLTGTVNGGVEQTILTGNGMLASAYNKISLISAFGWIRPHIYRNLSLLRKIRNEFAHHVELKSLEQPPVRDFVNSINAEREEDGIVKLFKEREHEITLTTRQRYLVRSSLTICHFVMDLAVSQAAIDNRVHPGEILTGGFDNNPENIKDLLREIGQVALDTLAPND